MSVFMSKLPLAGGLIVATAKNSFVYIVHALAARGADAANTNPNVAMREEGLSKRVDTLLQSDRLCPAPRFTQRIQPSGSPNPGSAHDCTSLQEVQKTLRSPSMGDRTVCKSANPSSEKPGPFALFTTNFSIPQTSKHGADLLKKRIICCLVWLGDCLDVRPTPQKMRLFFPKMGVI